MSVIDTSGLTFLDLGASKGDSMKWASNVFGGRGMGVDIDAKKIAALRSKGLEGVVADATALDIPDNGVPFVIMFDFLEHLPSRATGKAIIKSAVRVASDFVLIRGPDFGDAAYLRKNGLHKYYADWHGHKWHHTVEDLKEIISKLGFPHFVGQYNRIVDSFSHAIKPLGSKKDCGPYDLTRDGPKPFVQFDRRIYERLLAIVVKGNVSLDQVLARFGLVRIADGPRLPKLY
jgi:hypothetical protein